MASLKVKFRDSAFEDKEGVLYYQIIHKRVVRRVATNYKLFSCEWNRDTENVVVQQCSKRIEYLRRLQESIDADKERFETSVKFFLKQNRDFSVDEVIECFKDSSIGLSLFHYMENMIGRYRKYGQLRTAETYCCTLNSIKRFTGDRDVDMLDVGEGFIHSYWHYLKNTGVRHNTIAFYMHRLRAVYNRAVSQGVIEQNYPFRDMKIGIEKTRKRAIPIGYIRKLKAMYLADNSSKAFARDIFLFSFYTRGMSFIDIAFLLKSDIKYGTLSYRRRKTGQCLHIRWEACMERVVRKYNTPASSPYIFPILDAGKADLRKQYHNKLVQVNRYLRKLGKEIGLQIPLTMYVARHSWATAARGEGVPLSVISEGLGHDSERTTQVYLASLDNEKIDNANRKLIRLL